MTIGLFAWYKGDYSYNFISLYVGLKIITARFPTTGAHTEIATIWVS